MNNGRHGFRKLNSTQMEQVKLACKVFDAETAGALFGVSKSTVLRILRDYKPPVKGGRRLLTPGQVRWVRQYTMSAPQMAKALGVSTTSIRYILDWKSYKDIK